MFDVFASHATGGLSPELTPQKLIDRYANLQAKMVQILNALQDAEAGLRRGYDDGYWVAGPGAISLGKSRKDLGHLNCIKFFLPLH